MKFLGILALFLVTSAAAAAGPSFDCAKAESSAEELVCADPALAETDLRLADVYARALEVVRGLDAGGEEAEATLKATQRGWIKGRDECWKAEDLRACVEQAYLMREAELVASWMLREPYAEAAWSCDGSGNPDVYVMYFDTTLPGIRLEYGDGIAVMQLTSAVSGTRYDGWFGDFFWEKGSEAILVWDEEIEQSCVLVAG